MVGEKLPAPGTFTILADYIESQLANVLNAKAGPWKRSLRRAARS